jgi:two-component system sensor histidine kinase RegB
MFKSLSLSRSFDSSFLPIRLLIYLRWIAIFGQIFTVVVVNSTFGFPLPVIVLSTIIGLSITINGILTWASQHQSRISPQQLPYFLLFDMGQLTALLYVTGGLNNPFAVFLLAPVVIASSFLYQPISRLVTLAGAGCVVLLLTTKYPLPWYDGGYVHPGLLRCAIASALLLSMIFMSEYSSWIAKEFRKLFTAVDASQQALAREQKLASLGALAAAAAHELGSPLTTINIAIKDLLSQTSSDHPFREDLELILAQSLRCRDILQDLSRNFAQEQQTPMQTLPMTAALNVILNHLPKCDKATEIVFPNNTDRSNEPVLTLKPEVIYSLGNIIQNGQQFAQSKVTITIDWSFKTVQLIIKDDGPGYPSHIVSRIGEPYISGRPPSLQDCHLGLGLFIAQTLLAQTGANLYFSNENGAKCSIIWPRDVFREFNQDEPTSHRR